MIAATKAARAEPDGYTIFLAQDALAAGMTLYPDHSFDAEKDFVAIGMVNITANTFAGRPTLPANNFKELLTWMKAQGQNVKIGHPGVGSFGHLAEVLIVQEMGVKVIQVPYRGAGPALVDLLAGQVDLGTISAVVATPLVKAGKLKAYALFGRTRLSGLPDLPTFVELGYKNARYRFLAHAAGAGRHAETDHRQAQCRAAQCARRPEGAKDLCRRRYVRICGQ